MSFLKFFFLLIFFCFNYFLFAIPLKVNIEAENFLLYPMEANLLRHKNNKINWQADRGYFLSDPRADKVLWLAENKQGIYKITVANDKAYFLVYEPDAFMSREAFAYLLSLFLDNNLGSGLVIKELPFDHWSYNALQICLANKVINFYPDGFLKPFYPIKRVEAAKMLFELKNKLNLLQDITQTRRFNDLSSKHWAYQAVQNVLGLMPAIDEEFFGLNDTLTFGQAREIFLNLKELYANSQ